MIKSKINICILTLASLIMGSCQDLDLNPLSEGSSENWFNNNSEIEMALNELYRPALWYAETCRTYNTDRWTDDWNQREYTYDWLGGAITGEWADAEKTWVNTYKGITRANTIINSLSNAEGRVAAESLKQYEAEAKFFRACFYSYLVFLYGDVPFFTGYVTLEDAYQTGRTAKQTVLEQIYSDFDDAIANLPETSTGGVRRVTKPVACAFKARTAIWMLDWQKARDAAKACIDFGAYSLESDYGSIFLSKNKNSREIVFDLPRSTNLMESSELGSIKSFMPRNVGGTSVAQPSWELFLSYTCTDGLTVDKSPLFDPSNPFKNRDPRCLATTVEPGTEFLGVIYDPSPKAKKVLNVTTGKEIKNKDSKIVDQYASYNGKKKKKGVDEEWIDDKYTDVNFNIMRYADVLLMYAEAKMEMGELDQSMYDALNMVRARAYKADYTDIDSYPAITEKNQGELRKIIRNERRVELAWENRRWFDLIRWRLAEVACTRPIYSFPSGEEMLKNYNNGDWFFPKGVRPKIDEYGLVDLTPIYETGKVAMPVKRNFLKHEYLFPIPSKDIIVTGHNLEQNPGY